MQGQEDPVDSGYQVFDLQVVGGDRCDLMIMQPQGASPVQPRVAFHLVAGLGKPGPPTGSDQNDIAPPDRHPLCADHVIQFFWCDRVSGFEENLGTTVANQVQQHAARSDAFAVDLVDAAVKGPNAGPKTRREAVVELVVVIDVG